MKRLKWFLPLIVAFGLSTIAIVRTDFSPDLIAAPLVLDFLEEPSLLLSQRYHFIGKGRQSFVFESEDGQTVLKFFNRRYMQLPWYAFLYPLEKVKRDLRRHFYEESYLIAEKYLKEETGLLYVHLGPTQTLPPVTVIDRASRSFEINLNQIPFVIQKKAKPFYASMQAELLDSFFQIIARRVGLGITDRDHDVEHNFGVLEGKVIQIDPGRLVLDDLSQEEDRSCEWEIMTHRLRGWITKYHPETLPLFDERLRHVYRE